QIICGSTRISRPVGVRVMPVTCWIDRRRKSAALAPLAPNERLTLFLKSSGLPLPAHFTYFTKRKGRRPRPNSNPPATASGRAGLTATTHQRRDNRNRPRYPKLTADQEHSNIR